ncbi:thioredoxin family protein [Chitinophaga solisilvae]|uniref:thioredoxin family protein n=1 Tax=Chitinophaga solisilvae TaxID=1233460 RepID=UPI00136AE0AE|nr:thioredoxin family protein [Chitinophaga solisilvae]
MQKRKIGLVLLLLMPLFVTAQEDGVKFKNFTSWKEVVTTTQKQNKHIFIDCYATWCLPCKGMDNVTFRDSAVKNFMDKNFIAVKVQVDSTNLDAEEVVRWRKEAAIIKSRYNVNVVPTFLVFNANGELVHKGQGGFDPASFMQLLQNSLDSSKQYFTLLKKYEQGKKDYKELIYLSKTAKSNGDKEVAKSIARDFMDNYLFKQPIDSLFDRDVIVFVAENMDDTRSPEFLFFSKYSKRINDLMDAKDYVEMINSYLIAKERIDPKVWPGNKAIENMPDWEVLRGDVRKKFGQNYADRVVLNAKVRWYAEKENWPMLIKCQIEKKEKYGYDTSALGKLKLNNIIYELFFFYGNENELRKGIEWMKGLLLTNPEDPSYIDTYANLLYKSGQKAEAIKWERKALEIIEKTNSSEVQGYQETLDKMLAGLPTWIKK